MCVCFSNAFNRQGFGLKLLARQLTLGSFLRCAVPSGVSVRLSLRISLLRHMLVGTI